MVQSCNFNFAKCLLKVKHNLISLKRVATLIGCRRVFASSHQNGDVNQAQILLDKGVDPATIYNSGSTPIHYAAKGRNTDMVELLLEYGADPNVKDGHGLTPLHLAARAGHDGIVQLLLEYWADLNAKDISGSTPLHIAAKNEYEIVIELLLDTQADLFLQDNKGDVPASMTFKPDLVMPLSGKEKLAISWEASSKNM